MPFESYEHQVAAGEGLELRGWGYTTVADKAALPTLTVDSIGTIYTTADSGTNWRMKAIDDWVPWLDTNTVAIYPHLMPTTATNSVEIQADFDAGLLEIGDSIRTVRYFGDGNQYGGTDYTLVTTGTGTADAGSYVDFTGFQLQGQFSEEGVGAAQFGTRGDGTTDDTTPIQAAAQFVATMSGGKVIFAPGTYLCGEATVDSAVGVTLEGTNAGTSTLKLAPAASRIFHLTDIKTVAVRDLTFDADSAVGTGGILGNPLLHIQTTAATVGEKDFRVIVERCAFTGNTGNSQGHLRVQMHETAAATYSEFESVVFRDCSFAEYGATTGPAVRGPGRLVVMERLTIRNDGAMGAQTLGDSIGFFTVGVSCEVGNGHLVENVVVRDCEALRTTGFSFLQMVKTAVVENVTIRESHRNPSLDSTIDTFTADIGGNTITPTGGVPAGFVLPGAIVQVTGADLPAPLVSGNFYYCRTAGPAIQLALFSGGGTIDLTTAGSGVMNVQFMGMSFNTDIKGDDNRVGAGDNGNAAVHTYRNVRFVDSSAHQGHRNFSYETGDITAGSVRVVLEDCEFDRPVSTLDHDRAGNTFLDATRCTFGNRVANVSEGTTSSFSSGRATIDSCSFPGPGRPTITPEQYLAIKNCRFDRAFVLARPASTSSIVKLHDNVFNIQDTATERLDIEVPLAGSALQIDSRGNRKWNQVSANVIEVRVLLSGGDITTLTMDSSDDEWSMGDFGEADTDTFRFTSVRNRSTGTNAQRAKTVYPLSTFPNAPAVSMLGSDTWITAGTSGVPITAIIGDINYAKVTVYVQAGDTLVHGTGNIQTQSGQDITGPAVADLVFYDGNWREVGGAVAGGLTGTAQAYTLTNPPAADRVLQADGGATLGDTNAVLATLIADLQARGIIA